MKAPELVSDVENELSKLTEAVETTDDSPVVTVEAPEVLLENVLCTTAEVEPDDAEEPPVVLCGLVLEEDKDPEIEDVPLVVWVIGPWLEERLDWVVTLWPDVEPDELLLLCVIDVDTTDEERVSVPVVLVVVQGVGPVVSVVDEIVQSPQPCGTGTVVGLETISICIIIRHGARTWGVVE